MKLGEFPDGTYQIEQRLDADGNTSTTLMPVRKRWWWFGKAIVDRERVVLLRRWERVDVGEDA